MAYAPRKEDLKHLAANKFCRLETLMRTLKTERNTTGQFPHRDVNKIDTIVLHWTQSSYGGINGALNLSLIHISEPTRHLTCAEGAWRS